MRDLGFDKLRTILCLGAHSDDIEIGAGGTLMTLLAERRELDVHWVVFSAGGERGGEARASAEKLLEPAARKTIALHNFRDTCFPFVGLEIKERFLQLQREVQPELIFTHRREDMHQDHRLIAELTWNAFRNHLILEYEIPKYEGDLGAPNFFVPLAENLARQKVEHLLAHFPTQREKLWFTAGTFEGLMRLRAVECNAKSGYAEAFHCRKMVWC
ncbi:MAG TPA: PIG-L deacetylase family protein [Pirellulales bacterium]|jgi:LmbE family N-acetylglucosaminyl deacetylase